MSPSSSNKRPVRIAGCSGGFTDRARAITSLAGDPDVDAVIGDWLSEMVCFAPALSSPFSLSLHLI
jgi:hypothetical protein